MQLYPKLILDALAKVRYPGNGKDLVANGMIEDDIRIDGNKVSFSIIFEKPNDPFIRSVVKAAETAILTFISPDVDIKGNINVKSKQVARPNPENPLPGVKNIIAVSSGKGGVGKSTIASNLAVALARLGYKVGLLDADIFGPSAPTMFDIEDTDVYTENIGGRDLILPVERYGVKILSIGFFVRKNDAVLWRGGMASNALKQLITDAAWGDLDYFVLDLPPGTSDIHLTLVQTLAITGAIVVTTPQDIALIDAKKGIVMFEKVEVPVLGIVENMSVHICSNCGHHEPIFGTGGAEKLAEKYHTQLLGQMPLHISLREDLDKGTPTVISRPESEFTAIYRQLADRVAAQLYWQGEVIPGEISFRAV